MSEELTRTESRTSEDRTACSDDYQGSGSHADSSSHADSTTPTTPHERVWESDHQGARFGCVPFGRFWPATAVALRTGGASHSKWTRKTRPWNVSLQTAVVASSRIGTFDPSKLNSRRRLQSETLTTRAFSGLTARGDGREIQGRSRPLSCPKGQPHLRLLRPACVRAEVSGAVSLPLHRR